jgi:hypothetical protein
MVNSKVPSTLKALFGEGEAKQTFRKFWLDDRRDDSSLPSQCSFYNFIITGRSGHGPRSGRTMTDNFPLKVQNNRHFSLLQMQDSKTHQLERTGK